MSPPDSVRPASNMTRRKGNASVRFTEKLSPPFKFKISTDVDECAEKIHSCVEPEECLNTIGAYECVSSDGQDNQNDDCGQGLEFNATLGSCVGKII